MEMVFALLADVSLSGAALNPIAMELAPCATRPAWCPMAMVLIVPVLPALMPMATQPVAPTGPHVAPRPRCTFALPTAHVTPPVSQYR